MDSISLLKTRDFKERKLSILEEQMSISEMSRIRDGADFRKQLANYVKWRELKGVEGIKY